MCMILEGTRHDSYVNNYKKDDVKYVPDCGCMYYII